MTEAVYLGVYGYGTDIAARKNMDSFKYRFMINGDEMPLVIDNGEKDADGAYSYPIQNILKIGYTYDLKIDNGVITSAAEVRASSDDHALNYEPPVSGEAGERTLANLIRTALAPAGTTLYIYGGGWDWQDVGASIQVRSIGVSEDWIRFFKSHDESFTYRDKDGNSENKDPEHSYYPYNGYNEYYYAGLDCSGYVSWVMNNVFNKESVTDDHFSGATGTAKRIAERRYGRLLQEKDPINVKLGDVISISGHVWISVGSCNDGSIVILHSTPSESRTGQPGGGVQISAIGESKECEAYKLADKYMSEFYREWYSRYPVKLCDPDVYLGIEDENAGIFKWDTDSGAGLTDPDDMQNKSPAEILSLLFG